MAQPLMPKATAVWLVENTGLSFDQIATFVGLHELEVQAIADGEVMGGMVGIDPIANAQLTREEIAKAEADTSHRMKLAETDVPKPVSRQKGPRYTPVSKRQDKPDAIAWILRHHPELSDAQLGRLIGTTKPTINSVRDRTHWNVSNLRPRSPVELGLCSHMELTEEVEKARKTRRGAQAVPMKASEMPEEPELPPEPPRYD
ncbi:MAG: DUF1013 domain-containing protein [Alphaproteobacteria bacterium]|nr:DUF1013 domain-containing protein [Alphaproteobacteria bacterium]